MHVLWRQAAEKLRAMTSVSVGLDAVWCRGLHLLPALLKELLGKPVHARTFRKARAGAPTHTPRVIHHRPLHACRCVDGLAHL